VVTSAYTQLFAEGWIDGRHGSGTYVAEGAAGGRARAPGFRDGEGLREGRGEDGWARADRDGRELLGGRDLAPVGRAGSAGGASLVGAPGLAGGITLAGRAGPGGTGLGGGGGAGGTGLGGGAGAGGTGLGGGGHDAGPEARGAASVSASVRPLIELRPGIPWTAGIDRAAWRRAWRSAGDHAPAGEPSPLGLADLRSALTGYLRRSRGVRCRPREVLVTRGVAGSLSLIGTALLRPGEVVAVEEPGYPRARAVFGAFGARVVACRADADGLMVNALPAAARLVYTTPAHQYPLGGRLPVPRRQALISWARANGALIVEDDYDGEFRYDVAPLPALFGLDPDVVIYLGTTTKTLTPALRVGWLVARPELVSQLALASEALGEWAAGPSQRAVLSLINTGDLERHIRRMRHEYARRRAVMARAFRDESGVRVLGDEAGMHMVLEIQHDARAVVAAARDRGVAVATLERYFAGPVTVNGLVLGYGGAPVADVARGCEVVRELLGRPCLAGGDD
jgi:GntR family transcriptional regulator/MocR family aminotransferase